LSKRHAILESIQRNAPASPRKQRLDASHSCSPTHLHGPAVVATWQRRSRKSNWFPANCLLHRSSRPCSSQRYRSPALCIRTRRWMRKQVRTRRQLLHWPPTHLAMRICPKQTHINKIRTTGGGQNFFHGLIACSSAGTERSRAPAVHTLISRCHSYVCMIAEFSQTIDDSTAPLNDAMREPVTTPPQPCSNLGWDVMGKGRDGFSCVSWTRASACDDICDFVRKQRLCA
jgi:hypothetical protein